MADKENKKESKQTKEEIQEQRRMAKVNALLESLDKKLEKLIINIEMEKDKNDGGIMDPDKTINTQALDDFMSTINAIKVNGKDEVIIAINSKYNKAIKTLKDAVINGEEGYTKQFQEELNRLNENKSEKFDPMAETYKVLADRLEKGETQRVHFQDKADKEQARIDVNEKKYKDKSGNIDLILVSLEEPNSKIKEKQEIQKKYENILALDKKIKDKEDFIKNNALSDEEKAKIEAKIEETKKELEKEVKEFEANATDKDGNKYKKPEGKTYSEYIYGLDATKIQEAVNQALNDFSVAVKSIPAEYSKVSLLDEKLAEVEDVDARDVIPGAINTPEKADALIKELEKQKRLWKGKMLEDGYDKDKMQQQKRDYQNKANSYSDNIQEGIDADDVALSTNSDISFKDRFAFNRQNNKGFLGSLLKSVFGKKSTEKAMREKSTKTYGDIDIAEAKKEALIALEKNKGKLAKMSAQDKKDNKNNFKKSLNYNVSLTETEINEFWEKKEKTKETRDKKDTSKETGR